MSDDSIAHLERLLADDPSNVEARLRLADMLVARGRPEEAVEVYFVAARSLGRRRDGRRAIQVCLAIMQISPGHSATQELVRRLCATSLEAARTWREALGMASRRSAEPLPAVAPPQTSAALPRPRHLPGEHHTVTVPVDDLVHRLDRSGEITQVERDALLAATVMDAVAEARPRYGDRHETPTLQMPALDRRQTEAARQRIIDEHEREKALRRPETGRMGWARPESQDPRQMTFRGQEPRPAAPEPAPIASPPPRHVQARAIPSPPRGPSPEELISAGSRFAVPPVTRTRGVVPPDANRTLDARRRLDDLAARTRSSAPPPLPAQPPPEDAPRAGAGRVPREAMRSHTGAGDARDALERLRAARRVREEEPRQMASPAQAAPVPAAQPGAATSRGLQRSPLVTPMSSTERAQTAMSTPSVAFSVPHPEEPPPSSRQVFQPASTAIDVTGLASSPLWDKLDSAAVRQLLDATTLLRLPPRTTLIDADQPPNRLLVILRGEVELVVQQYGMERSLGPCRPGSVLGASELLKGSFQQRVSRAVGEVDVLEVGARVLTALGRRDPTVWNLIWESHYDHLLRMILATHPVFEGFRLDERAAVRDRFRRRYARAGDAIVRRGDAGAGLYLVLNGRVRVERGPGVEAPILEVGALFDAGASGFTGAAFEALVAVENATVLFLGRDQLHGLFEAHPQMALAIRRL